MNPTDIANEIDETPDGAVDPRTCPHNDIDGIITSASTDGGIGATSVHVSFIVTCNACGTSWSSSTIASNVSIGGDGEWSNIPMGQ